MSQMRREEARIAADAKQKMDRIRMEVAGVLHDETTSLKPVHDFLFSGGKAPVESNNPKDKIGRTKVPMHLVPSVAIAHTALAMRDGANKYGPYNWRANDVAATVYLSAAERHIRSWLEGEDNATDSGIHHLGHAMACLAIMLDAQEGGNLVDDRPLKGPLPYMLQRAILKTTETVSAVVDPQVAAKEAVAATPLLGME